VSVATSIGQVAHAGQDPRAAALDKLWEGVANSRQRTVGVLDKALMETMSRVSSKELSPYMRGAGLGSPIAPETDRSLGDHAVGRYRALTAAPRPRPKAITKLKVSDKQIVDAQRARLLRAHGANRIREYQRFQLFTQWDGHVYHVGPAAFSATVVRRTAHGRGLRNNMHFPLRLVRDQDRDLLTEGASIYYCVGRFQSALGPIPGAVVWVRRLPPSNYSAEEALTRGAKLAERIGWTT